MKLNFEKYADGLVPTIVQDAETGKVVATHPAKTTLRWIYKTEMELLLRLAGFARWEILGGFDGRPLLHETDAMIVKAWTAPGPKAGT